MEIIRLIPLIGFLVFCLQIGIRAFVLQRKGTKLSDRKSSFKAIISSAFLIVFFFIFLNELVYKAGLIHFSVLPDVLHPLLIGNVIFTTCGIVLLLLSNLLMLVSLRALNQSLRFGLNKGNLGKLVTSGIYARSRNPFFLAINCLFVGIALIFPSLFFIAICLLTLVSIHLFILKEERFMHKNYGKDYKNYAKTVRRYF
ncbi:isoprenylcysteine carboxylmethyltransferase family protein [Draconibacterium sp.]|uniref:methyltransferase family protein n=1 Tax=Draconibacterium sp. TaxID=1965318 RepID=UPI00356AAD82